MNNKIEKKKLTIYVPEDVAKAIKVLAINKDISLSQLTESLFIELLNKEDKSSSL